jgi:hypothetical protein
MMKGWGESYVKEFTGNESPIARIEKYGTDPISFTPLNDK